MLPLGVNSAYVSKNLTVDFEQNILERDPVLKYEKPQGFKRLWIKLIQKIAPSPYLRFKRKLKAYSKGGFETLTVPFSPYRLEDHPLIQQADIVHLHWVSELVDARFFKNLNKPLVWTFHDMNPLMGVFHYTTDIGQADKKLKVLDALFRSHKARQYRSINKLTVVSPSEWLKQAALQSTMFPQDSFMRIANPISFQYKTEVKDVFSNDHKALCIAHDLRIPRKGMHLLQEALNSIHISIDLSTLGKGELNCTNPKIHVNALGAAKSPEEIMECYANSDVLILPSIEDNLPNTMLEALSVGTPVVAFNTGGMAETIKPGFNGLLAPEMTAESLAETLNKFFKEKHTYNRNAIREDAKLQFEAASQASKYLEVYKRFTP